MSSEYSTCLKEKIPHLFVMRCICTLLTCVLHMPVRNCLGLLRMWFVMYTHISATVLKGQLDFKNSSSLLKLNHIRYSSLRRLSLQMCVSRILEQWDALELFFADAAEIERLVAAENVASTLKTQLSNSTFSFLTMYLLCSPSSTGYFRVNTLTCIVLPGNQLPSTNPYQLLHDQCTHQIQTNFYQRITWFA